MTHEMQDIDTESACMEIFFQDQAESMTNLFVGCLRDSDQFKDLIAIHQKEIETLSLCDAKRQLVILHAFLNSIRNDVKAAILGGEK